MITDLQLYGEVRRVTLAGSATLVLSWPRVVQLSGTGTLTIPAPDARRGGPIFFLVNTGVSSLTISTAHGTLPSTLPVGGVLALYNTPGGWVGELRTGASTLSLPVAPTASTTADADAADDCSDLCNPSQTYRTVPMFIDPHYALNEQRDPIRGANLRVPDKLQFTLRDTLVRDTNHSHAAPLSEALQRLLFRRPLTVTYDAASFGTSSRHPHHIELVAGSWTSSTRTVVRQVWRLVRTYRVGAATHTFELRFVAEYVENESAGAWGTLFSLYAFSTEVNPSYVEGADDPSQNNTPFTRDDPLVYRPLGGSGSVTRWKLFHPQLLFAAHIPTTFQAALGGLRVPVGDELWAKLYERSNGAPWSSGSAADAWKNTVFSRPTVSGQTAARCITLGGDVPSSALYPFLVIENGGGYGGTYLKPTNAGWDEAAGELNALSDISIRDCGFTQPEVSTCYGQPGAVYVSPGGTHRCFLTTAGPEATCYPPDRPATLLIREPCCANVTTYAADCTPTATSCVVASFFTTPFYLRVDDYDFGRVTASDRFIEWRTVRPDPSYVRPEWSSELSATTELSTQSGTWTYAATPTGGTAAITAVAGSGTLRAVTHWNVSMTCGHAKGRAKCKTSAGKTHVVLVRWTGSNGYALMLEPSSSQLRIYRVTSGALTLLATTTGVTMSSDVEASWEAIGTRLRLAVGTASVEVHDLTYTHQGVLGLATTSTTAGAEFSDLLLEDWNTRVENPGTFVSGAQVVLSVRIDEDSPVQTLTVVYQRDVCGKAQAGGCAGTASPCGTTVDGECMGNCTKTEIVECTNVVEVPETFSSAHAQVSAPDGAAPVSTLAPVCPPPFRAVEVRLPVPCSAGAGGDAWAFRDGITFWANEGQEMYT